ncbi:hypothetical protein LzC2_27230 [Planctomycetes bacterium LzC2]|uniref:Glycoside hydrolase family 38 N-terminal domain-containing protein n=1 Tax=Alienimonas chondri TaxID=2681879 RepID=A0ABX1VEV8_9PLAN|nr:hypothetical protein [Alienimonas chondri]
MPAEETADSPTDAALPDGSPAEGDRGDVPRSEGPAETVLLLPSHGLDDLPERLPERQAGAALNAFALAWHPSFLATVRALPRLVMADQPPHPVGGRRFLIPDFVRELLPEGWEADAGDRLAIIGPDRATALDAVKPLLSHADEIAPDDLHPFFALGLGFLWVERLTRRTHYYSTLDETRLRTEAVAAADALFAGDREEAREKLVEAVEVLREARERFYPTPAKLCDLCFVIPRLAGEALRREIAAAAAGGPALNLLATGADWRTINEATPELIAAIRVAGEKIEPVGGEESEIATNVRDVPAAIADLTAGRETFRELFGSPPGVWGRYRFGFPPLTPQLLESFGVNGALHLKFGPGSVPPDGAGRVRWAGAGGEIPAHARDPLPAGAAASYWALPEILAEAFEAEQTVAVTFARWPGTACPGLDDLKTLTALSPALGEFATYSEMFAEDDPFARVYGADPRKYRSPAATEMPPPIATDAEAKDDAVFTGLCELLGAGGEGDSAERLAATLCRGGGGAPGTLWLNALPVPRIVGVECGDPNVASKPPADHPAVKVVGARSFTFELPPCGFVWFPDQPKKPAPISKAKAKTAEPGLVRNERFEVMFDPATGGIAAVKNYGRSPVRLGMRPALRFKAPRTLTEGEPELYSRCVRTEGQTWDVVDAGPARGELVSRGVLIDPAGGARLCGFTLRVQLDRGSRTAHVAASFDDPATALEAGDLVLRWAWDDETAELARSIQGSRQAAPAHGTFEAAHFWELTSLHGSEKLRTAVLTPDAPYHSRSGRRMLDTPLLNAGDAADPKRVWRFGIAVDDPHPMRAADAFLSPPTPIAAAGPPASGPIGWLLACDSAGVRLLSVRREGDETHFRVQETDGRTRTAALRCFKPPTSARKRTLGGDPREELVCEADAIRVPLAGYEITDVVVRW